MEETSAVEETPVVGETPAIEETPPVSTHVINTSPIGLVSGTGLIYLIRGESAVIRGCLGGITVLEIPEFRAGQRVTEITEGAFAGNGILTSVSLPAGVTAIGARAFENCTALTSADIAGTETVGEAAFAGCALLENLTTSGALTEIGEDAFAGCDALVIRILRDSPVTASYCEDHGIRYTSPAE